MRSVVMLINGIVLILHNIKCKVCQHLEDLQSKGNQYFPVTVIFQIHAGIKAPFTEQWILTVSEPTWQVTFMKWSLLKFWIFYTKRISTVVLKHIKPLLPFQLCISVRLGFFLLPLEQPECVKYRNHIPFHFKRLYTDSGFFHQMHRYCSQMLNFKFQSR